LGIFITLGWFSDLLLLLFFQEGDS